MILVDYSFNGSTCEGAELRFSNLKSSSGTVRAWAQLHTTDGMFTEFFVHGSGASPESLLEKCKELTFLSNFREGKIEEKVVQTSTTLDVGVEESPKEVSVSKPKKRVSKPKKN